MNVYLAMLCCILLCCPFLIWAACKLGAIAEENQRRHSHHLNWKGSRGYVIHNYKDTE